MRRLVVLVLTAAACFVAAAPSVAQAATPCWQRVIEDWTRDGQINGDYSPKCLRQAYNNVPEDLADYSSIKDDINAALLGPSGSNSGNGGPSSSGNSTGTNGASQSPSAVQAKKRAEQAVPHAGTPESIPASSRTLPLPLLILAAVALAAMAAAGSPPLIRRVRRRFPRGRPAPQTDRS